MSASAVVATLLALAAVGYLVYRVYEHKKAPPKKGGSGGGAPDIDPPDHTNV